MPPASLLRSADVQAYGSVRLTAVPSLGCCVMRRHSREVAMASRHRTTQARSASGHADHSSPIGADGGRSISAGRC